MPTIDNAGGGNCGFLALATGLIEIVQREAQTTGGSETFENWKRLSGFDYELPAITDIDLVKLANSPGIYQYVMMQALQASLRDITAESYSQDLVHRIRTEQLIDERMNLVEGSVVFGRVMEIVEEQDGRAAADMRFNELKRSPAVISLARRALTAIQRALGLLPATAKTEDASRVTHEAVKATVVQDVMKEGQPNPDSVILKAIDGVKQPGRWATHQDLNQAAAALNVNLKVTGEPDGEIAPERPTVTLNNLGNTHWTTEVSTMPGLTEVETPKPISQKKATQTVKKTIALESDKGWGHEKHISKLLEKQSIFRKRVAPKDRIDLKNIDNAVAKEGEKDEQFATRLQDAELRRAKFYR